MNKKPIAAIVNFCTNESRFLKACIEQARLFARQIIIPVCDHFFDGTPEKAEELDLIYRSFPDCTFIQYPFIPDQIPKGLFKRIAPNHFWHSLSRLIAVNYLEDTIETILFLDADEVPDGKKFSEWLDSSDYHQHMALKLANYWYFREPRYQATLWEDSIVLAQRRALTSRLLLDEREREAIYDFLPGPKRRNVTASDGKPMFHHFSWVRTKEEMLKKVRSWGHRGDRSWEAQVEEEFSAPFRGTDFVHGYKFNEVVPQFDIRLDQIRFEPALPQAASLKRLTSSQVLKLLKSQKNQTWGWLTQIFINKSENP
ncbi:MAG: hypothetical protein JSS32_00955 [Verrucomicrobia bacterium]|nr:hypothetical protein [Verrucomicrobiota bacterium]